MWYEKVKDKKSSFITPTMKIFFRVDLFSILTMHSLYSFYGWPFYYISFFSSFVLVQKHYWNTKFDLISLISTKHEWRLLRKDVVIWNLSITRTSNWPWECIQLYVCAPPRSWAPCSFCPPPPPPDGSTS